jgi:hypothetical protein
MVPSSLFVHVIEAERQRDLERWQLARLATLSAERSTSRRPAASLVQRVWAALGAWSLSGRSAVGCAPGAETTNGAVACC